MNPELEIVTGALAPALTAAGISRTIDQYKNFGMYDDVLDGFLTSVVANVEHILSELKDEL